MAPSSELNADEDPAESEHVMEHTSASTLHPDDGEARPGKNSMPQPQESSRQVCLSSRAVLLSVCVYAYLSCDRVQCCRLWILPIAPHHHALPHDARQRPLCSFLPRLRVSHPLTPSPTLFLQKNPTHQISYPSIRHRRRHRHRRCVDLVAVTHRSSPRPTSKDGN